MTEKLRWLLLASLVALLASVAVLGPAGVVLYLLLMGRSIGAPAPMTRPKEVPPGVYTVQWDGASWDYELRADGTSWCFGWNGNWSWDRSARTLWVHESYNGGPTRVWYAELDWDLRGTAHVSFDGGRPAKYRAEVERARKD